MSNGTYSQPSNFEAELAEALEPILPTADGFTEMRCDLIAEALAMHRRRCTGLVLAMLASVDADGVSPHALGLFAHGYTPDGVRRLVEAHRLMLARLAEARALIPGALAGLSEGRAPGG